MVAPHELGPLEMQVLGLLEGAEPLSVSEVRSRLSASGHELAYTTVMTVLSRLHGKGLLTRKKEQNRYLYAAGRRGSRAAEGFLARVKNALFQGDKTRPIMALLDDDELSAEELRALREVIDERLKGKP